MRLALALMLVCSTAHAQSLAAGTPTTPLVARQTFEAAPVGGPWLNASVAHFRAVQPSTASGVTMLHGLYLESVLGSSLLPWAFYAELRTAHAIGAGVVNYARLRNEGPGWAAAFHTDVVASGSGPSIGVNVETSPMNQGTGRTIGVNVQSTADYAGEASTRATNEGINLQNQVGASFVDGIRFDAARDAVPYPLTVWNVDDTQSIEIANADEVAKVFIGMVDYLTLEHQAGAKAKVAIQ